MHDQIEVYRKLSVRNKFLIEPNSTEFPLLLFCYKTRCSCYVQFFVPIGYIDLFYFSLSIKKQNITNMLVINRGIYCFSCLQNFDAF